MRQLNTSEVLAINKFLQMETNALAMAKAGINAIGDEQLRTLTQAGITATVGRIKGLQQFITENNVAASTNNSSMYMNANMASAGNSQSNNSNLPGGVV